MIKWIKTRKDLLIVGIAVTASVPIFIVGYEVLFGGQNSVRFTFDSVTGGIVVLYYLALIFLGVGFFIRWLIGQIMIVRRLKNEKTQAELLHLKAQVNPHFFFNTLNNLYGWIDKNPSIAKDLVLQLADMMRYNLYDGQKDKVTIDKEVAFLNNYIKLHQMRYQKDIDIRFELDIKDDHMKVMPLLFIILVENAFKHGVEALRKSAFVHIKLKADEKEITFEVKNNFEPDIDKKKGIGLQNLRRRLNIMYANNYKLTTESSGDTFTALLSLNII